MHIGFRFCGFIYRLCCLCKGADGCKPIDTAINTVFDTVKEVFTTDTALKPLKAAGGDDLTTGIAAVIETLKTASTSSCSPAIVIVSYAFYAFWHLCL